MKSAETNLIVYKSFTINESRDKFGVFFNIDEKPYSRIFNISVPIQNVPIEEFKTVVFHLGLFCLVDLDQLYAPKKILIEAGKLTPEQIEFYLEVRDLYARQHFFEKRASLSQLTRDITTTGPCFERSEMPLRKDKIVAAFGGGKESILYKTLFDNLEIKPLWFFKSRKIFRNTLESIATDSSLEDCINITEDTDLYKNNYIHKTHLSRTNTGISIYMMAMILLALERKYGNLCFGNERSAIDPYCLWDGYVVNHQFDKTPEYRKKMEAYIQKYIAKDVHLFSIFEGMYEYKIAQLIRASDIKDFKNMTSCNYMTNKKKWCHECPKCAWSFAVLAYAFGLKSAIDIVGANLFDKPRIYADILNPNVRKPFECIGERPEIWLILNECIRRGQKGEVLNQYKKEYFPRVKNCLNTFKAKYEEYYENPALPEIIQANFAQVYISRNNCH